MAGQLDARPVTSCTGICGVWVWRRRRRRPPGTGSRQLVDRHHRVATLRAVPFREPRCHGFLVCGRRIDHRRQPSQDSQPRLRGVSSLASFQRGIRCAASPTSGFTVKRIEARVWSVPRQYLRPTVRPSGAGGEPAGGRLSDRRGLRRQQSHATAPARGPHGRCVRTLHPEARVQLRVAPGASRPPPLRHDARGATARGL